MGTKRLHILIDKELDEAIKARCKRKGDYSYIIREILKTGLSLLNDGKLKFSKETP